MATFSINLLNDGTGSFTPSVRRNPTIASGGTTVTIPWVENTLNGASTTSPFLASVIWQGFTSMFNSMAATPAGQLLNWDININDDGAQLYSVDVRYSGTAASGGTALTIPWVENTLNGANTASAFEASVMRVCVDAIANSTSVTGV
tara:strand:+ start:464 stop:904 length:441 start_codon:yes stop_codon:yes gene_type:complete